MRSFFVGSVVCLFASCRGRDRAAAADSTQAGQRPPAALASAPNADSSPAPPPSDYAVYATVLREHFMRPERGEHALLCEREGSSGRLAVVGTTQPLAPGTPPRDSLWATLIPAPAAPLMAALRAMDRQPGRALDVDSLVVGIPIHLVPDSAAARALRLTSTAPADRPHPGAPALFWFSRVAYTADGKWALVYAVEVCPGITDAMATEAETGAYESTLLAPLERRAGVWTVHPPLFLDVGLPRLERR